MQNPFEELKTELKEIKEMVYKLLIVPKEDLSEKMYTVKEASLLMGVDSQTIRNHIENGNIKATRLGSRKIFINHNELYDSLQELKSLKYKRSA